MNHKPNANPNYVFPAWAGVDLFRPRRPRGRRGIPRVGGGRPFRVDFLLGNLEYSPRGRG